MSIYYFTIFLCCDAINATFVENCVLERDEYIGIGKRTKSLVGFRRKTMILIVASLIMDFIG